MDVWMIRNLNFALAELMESLSMERSTHHDRTHLRLDFLWIGIM